ncbi:DEKNAAC101125 [Brettanomyces naardenensis]|uniref:DEKNAAC101125 n=1 Tax=Brettanomyces naardenensis TaxID=13370 RepID=A0A448YHD1_BRENA|nr:DEKNAAC101125 [Brettanomyces naardenensis]
MSSGSLNGKPPAVPSVDGMRAPVSKKKARSPYLPSAEDPIQPVPKAMSVRLTPTQEHYLKKELLNIEITGEFSRLSPRYNDVTGLRRFGPPFKDCDPKNPTIADGNGLADRTDEQVKQFDQQFPVLRFVVQNYVATFPFIRMHLKKLGPGLDQATFWDKIQELFETWKSKKISNSNDRGELSRRQLGLFKTKSLLVMLFNSAIRCTGDEIYFKTDTGERNAYKKLAKLMGENDVEDSENSDLETISSLDGSTYVGGLDINVVGVTRVLDNLAISGRRKSHYEFIIRVKAEKPEGEQWYVRRRYSDFVQFHRSIKLLYVGNKIPNLPSKDKSKLSFDVEGADDDLDSLNETASITTSLTSEESSMATATPDIYQLESRFLNFGRLIGSRDSGSSSRITDKVKFPRENMRISLRGYLKLLCSIDVVRRSHEFDEFIGASPVLPTEIEMNDISAREKLDNLVNLQHLKFQQETIKIVKRIEESMVGLREEVLNSGMEYIFKQLREHDTIAGLSSPFKALIQLIELEVASTQYEMLIGSDSAHDTFRSIKRIHSLFPYRIVATIMRFTNPLQVMKSMIDLFTYQMPHFFHKGRRMSLLQTLFTGILADDVKKAEREIEKAKEKYERKTYTLEGSTYDYRLILKKIEAYFEYSDDEVLHIKKEAEYFNMELLLSILLGDQREELPEDLAVEVIDSYLATVGSKKEKGHSDVNSLYGLADIYFKLQLRKYDRSMLIELWEEPEMMAVTKEVLAIFFEPLISLFKKAELYKYIPVFARYMSELIELIEYYQKDYNKFKQTDIVASFTALEDKFAQYAYEFLHNLYMNDLSAEDEDDRIFDGLAKWFDGFVRLLRFAEDRGGEANIDMNELLDTVLPDPADRARVIQRVDLIIAEIEKKRNYYESIRQKNLSRTTSRVPEPMDQMDNDYMKSMRNGKLTKNWDKINERVIKLTNQLANEGTDTSEGNAMYSMVGLNNEDVREMNLDLMEVPEKDSEAKRRWISSFESGTDFLDAYKEANSGGSLETDAEFKALQEWEDTKYNNDLGKLSGPFREMVYEKLAEFKQAEANGAV